MVSSQNVPSCNSSPLAPRGRSKAQKSLWNILRVISTVPPPPAEGTPERRREVRVFGVDLNVGFVPPEVKAESEVPVDPDVGNGGGGGVEVEMETETEKLSERSELSDGKGRGEEGLMGLLIDAAKLIFGDFDDDKNSGADSRPEQGPENNSSESQNSDMTKITTVDSSAAVRNAEEEVPNSSGEASPVKRSKRGRIRTLPCKYRDSVLEPLTRFSRTRSTTILANRRRSR